MSGNDSYKIWHSLTEPLIFKGVPVEYLLVVLTVTGFIAIIPIAPVWLVGSVLVTTFVIGIVMTRKDKRWFSIFYTLITRVGIRAFRRTRYVR
jgi:type IV secretory pathway VirB3-like protein